MTDNLYTETECNILKAQVERRARCRQEFLRLRTDPCIHSQEAGYVVSLLLRSVVPVVVSCSHEENPGSSFLLFLYTTWYLASSSFDPALQRFMSMKATQFGYFKASPTNLPYFVFTIGSMVLYGALMWKQRADRERQIRCGNIKYRDRIFKLA